MNGLEMLLRRWSMGEQKESQEERERKGKKKDKRHEKAKGKIDEGVREKRRRRKTEDRSDRKTREEEEDTREEFGHPTRRMERTLSGRNQGERGEIKDRSGGSGKKEEKIGRVVRAI